MRVCACGDISAEALVEGLETALERETNADLAEAWALAVAQDWILKHESIYDEARTHHTSCSQQSLNALSELFLCSTQWCTRCMCVCRVCGTTANLLIHLRYDHRSPLLGLVGVDTKQLESKFHELGIDFESEQKELSVDTSRALLAQALPRFGPLRWCVPSPFLTTLPGIHSLHSSPHHERSKQQEN